MTDNDNVLPLKWIRILLPHFRTKYQQFPRLFSKYEIPTRQFHRVKDLLTNISKDLFVELHATDKIFSQDITIIYVAINWVTKAGTLEEIRHYIFVQPC